MSGLGSWCWDKALNSSFLCSAVVRVNNVDDLMTGAPEPLPTCLPVHLPPSCRCISLLSTWQPRGLGTGAGELGPCPHPDRVVAHPLGRKGT